MKATWKTQDGSVKIDCQEIGLGSVNCIDVAQVWCKWRASMNKVTNIRVQ